MGSVRSKCTSLAARVASSWIFAFLWFLPIGTGGAQALKGRTIVYKLAGHSGQIFVAPSGSVYRALANTPWGFQYRLGRTMQHDEFGCREQDKAALDGSILRLDEVRHCKTGTSVFRIEVTVNGSSCRLVVGDDKGTNIPADSCEVLPGNHLPK